MWLSFGSLDTVGSATSGSEIESIRLALSSHKCQNHRSKLAERSGTVYNVQAATELVALSVVHVSGDGMNYGYYTGCRSSI